ncbi:YhbY family RNA-binding protein [Amphibiibacter pelophylacis]|uniref:YhbY family RNA-binding protein n=1 Tax=Amphibiibacter pelophylacis TaxID=1799477 RepID=A0ACC6NZW8_9BURK
MSAIPLTPAQRKDLRAHAHGLSPVVMIGADGLTPGVRSEIDRALNSHGLIKVRVFSDDRAAREALLVQISHDLHAAPVQHIGKLLVLWRPQPEPEETEARADRKAGPRLVTVLKQKASATHRAKVARIKVYGNERVTAGGHVKRAKVRKISLKKQHSS